MGAPAENENVGVAALQECGYEQLQSVILSGCGCPQCEG